MHVTVRCSILDWADCGDYLARVYGAADAVRCGACRGARTHARAALELASAHAHGAAARERARSAGTPRAARCARPDARQTRAGAPNSRTGSGFVGGERASAGRSKNLQTCSCPGDVKVCHAPGSRTAHATHLLGVPSRERVFVAGARRKMERRKHGVATRQRPRQRCRAHVADAWSNFERHADGVQPSL